MYWSLDEDIRVEVVSKAMSRNRFKENKTYILYLHVSNTRDKMFKVQKLADLLIRKFNQWNVFHKDISINESMVKYYGHGWSR